MLVDGHCRQRLILPHNLNAMTFKAVSIQANRIFNQLIQAEPSP